LPQLRFTALVVPSACHFRATTRAYRRGTFVSYTWGVAVSAPLPDEPADAIRAHRPVDARGAGDALEAFFGIGDSAKREPFDIKQIRLDAAERRLSRGD